MGNFFNKVDKEVVVDKFNDIKEIIIEHINQLLSSKNKIINYIEDSYNNSLFYSHEDIYKWKANIIKYVNYVYEGKDKEIEKLLIEKGIIQGGKNKNKSRPPQKEHNEILNNSIKEERINFITSKDIQIKLGEITREFESYSGNFITDEEQGEKTLAQNLLNIANLSRYCYNQSNTFLKYLYKEHEKENKGKDMIISSPEQIKIQFYFWFKNNKNQALIKSLRDKFTSNIPIEFLKHLRLQSDTAYIKKLFINLFDLYFHSYLSFPPVEILFLNEKDINYDSKRMIDYFDNRIRGIKKVYFEYFPSFFSNGNFLENGKHWVYTYRENKIIIRNIQLLKLDDKFAFPQLGEIINLEIVEKKYLAPKVNYKIKEGVNYEYKYYLLNKIDRKIREKKSNFPIEIEENEKLVKCEFILMNKVINFVEFNN